MRAHTPGPWSIVHTFNIVGGVDGRRGVANAGGYSENINQEACHEENIANATLIAAAPKMLAALKRAVAGADAALTSGGRTVACQREYDACVAAIASAEGRDN